MTAPIRLADAYAGKRVFLTGHTGFKGGWLALWLADLGAEVTGYALAPDTDPSLFVAAGVAGACRSSVVADVRDRARLAQALADAQPDFVFHLAAQPLVRLSYREPLGTLETNVMGTANLLEAVRSLARPCAVVVVTSDKCYENREWQYGYREDDAMGGHDVYSMSKGAAELVVGSWRRSFFDPARLAQHGVALATARAGNVIGGGDWCMDRLVPDAIRALGRGLAVPVRNPEAVRPWQHVLEPLSGYLELGARLAVGRAERAELCGPFNFGPLASEAFPVERVMDEIVRHWGEPGARWEDRRDPNAPHEATLLRLAIDKAWARLGWKPRWTLSEALRRTVEWYRAQGRGGTPAELRALCSAHIRDYMVA